MGTLTFCDSNGVFSSSLMMWRQLTLADIYTPGSSARALRLAETCVSPAPTGPCVGCHANRCGDHTAGLSFVFHL